MDLNLPQPLFTERGVKMQAVILAAGRGVRMGELTNDIPKPLLKISGKPIVEYTLFNLPEEISEIIFVIGYKGEMIRQQFGDEFNGKRISYVEQKELNGTAGALWLAKDILRDKFLVLMGDDLYHRDDLRKIIRHDLAILIKAINEPSRFGVVETDKEGNLVRVVERPQNPKSNLVNTGAYVLNLKFFDYALVPVYNGTEFGLPQTLAQMADKYKIKVERAEAWHPNTIGNDLAKAEEVVRKYFKMD